MKATRAGLVLRARLITQVMGMYGRQQPLAHTLPDGQVAGSTPPEVQAVVPDGH